MKQLVSSRAKKKFNKLALHPLQSWEWGEFRRDTNVGVVRWGVYKKSKIVEGVQVTLHKIPGVSWTVGYLPKGRFPGIAQVRALRKIAKEYKCIFIKCEPMVELKGLGKNRFDYLKRKGFVPGKPLFTRYNFELDLNFSEDELFANLKSKTRYNVRLAKKKGVKVSIDNRDEAFERYLELTKETTKRQGYYAHSQQYHRKMWDKLVKGKIARLIKAEYKGEVITAWILFKHAEVMYYPYGASSRKHQSVMANNLVMWEAIKLAKKEGCTTFDMWGALGPNPDKNDPWYGFHRFKEGYGGRHVEYMGTYDYVARPFLYKLFRIADSIRWSVLRMLKR